MSRIFCIGEALIDFICKDINTPLKHGENFVKKAGGAPANVAAAVVKLGGAASFCGKVGSDAFGHYLVEEMSHHGIDCTKVVMDKELPTTLAFVSLKEGGERDFEFFRGADGALRTDEIPSTVIDEYDIFHFGSATGLLDGEFKSAYMGLLMQAKSKGKFTSFDPNFRDLLWKDGVDAFISRVKECLPYVDLIKMSEEEAELIFSTRDKTRTAEKVHAAGIRCMTITCGDKGTYVSVIGNNGVTVPSINIKSIDSTGAGDAFVGAMLYKLSQSGIAENVLTNEKQMQEFTEFSNKVGAITCTKLGAMEAVPSIDEVKKF